VLTGSQVPTLSRVAANQVVAFRVDAAGGWTQIPVQVDERVATTMNKVYGVSATTTFAPYTSVSVNIPVTVYADPGTFVGADPDPTLDPDDEIAFMARDAGVQAPSGLAAPAATTGGGVQLAVTDPIDAAAGYVYLFGGNGSLDPGAGKQYVNYTFSLSSGDYQTTYKRTDGPNPENSTITGDTYTTHFADRWLEDSLTLTKGDRPTTDLIDRVKYDIRTGSLGLSCFRNENTFDDEEGAFIVNRSGPVRALRGYVGSNSGPNTANNQVFYDQAVYTTIDLRVHSIPNLAGHVDLNRSALGMTYRNPQVPDGVTVDGQPDSVPAGPLAWWSYTGAQGGLAISATLDSDASSAAQVLYEDNFNGSSDNRCTGDTEAVGDAGASIPGGASGGWIACTDPGSGCSNHLQSKWRLVAAASSATPADLQRLGEQGLEPLTVTASPF
jgi:hypothetical protein